MERVGSTAMAMLLCFALVASACGDGVEGPGVSPIDDLLGVGAVQDFTIHLGLWVAGDDGEPVDVSEPLVERLRGGAGEEIALDGGFTLAPVTDVDARMVDADGAQLPSLSVDLGLLASTPEAAASLPAELASIETGEGQSPLLVEIVTADYAASRDHAGPGDRSEIDVTFLEELEPGDAAASLYFFGQTLPGDAVEEAGLGPLELFAYRWNRGLARLLGDGGRPQPLVDTALEAKEGSTILSREQKGELTQILSVPFLGPNSEAFRGMREDLFLNEQSASPGTDTENTVTGAVVPVAATGEHVVVECYRRDGREACGVGLPDGSIIDRLDRGQVNALVRAYLLFATCTAVAAALAANNEAGRRPVPNVLDRYPSRRPSFADPPELVPDESVPDDSEVEAPAPFGCEPPPDPSPRGGGLHGDVRFTTFDGVVYGQQAVGEFFVLESDTTVIQVRAEPAGTSDRLSIATGIAVGTGGQAIAMHRGERTFIDGVERAFERGERVRVGDAEVLKGYFDWTIAWPDGQVVHVYDRGDANGMMLTVESAPDPVAGQLGDGNGDPTDDFVTRDGQVLPPEVVDDFDLFYGTYVESWRITQDESLLHYAEGETTETFLIDGFPSGSVSIDDLDADARAEAEQACEAASVVDDRFFDGCVVDIAVTGDPGHAYDAFRMQIVAAPPDAAPADDVTAVTPGDTVVSFGGTTLVFGDDPPDQRDGGVAPSWSCQTTDGNLFADGSIDLAEGDRYSISVEYLAAEPRLSLIIRQGVDGQGTVDHAWVLTNVEHFADAVEAVSLNGTRLTAAGQIFVNDPPELGLAPLSSLPDDATLDRFTLDLACTG